MTEYREVECKVIAQNTKVIVRDPLQKGNAMTNREICKVIATNVVGLSATFTVGSVLKQNIQPKTNLQKAEVAVGSTVIGMSVGEVMSARTAKFVDKIFDLLEAPAPQ